MATSCVADKVTISTRMSQNHRASSLSSCVPRTSVRRVRPARQPTIHCLLLPDPVHQRCPEKLECPGKADRADQPDLDQSGAMGAEIDRERFIDQAEGKTRRKRKRGQPCQPHSQGSRRPRPAQPDLGLTGEEPTATR